jgi:predicted AAA+ superfamily ATPase
MENIIYNELILRGYSVDIGIVTDRRNQNNVQKEIDFVVNFGDKRVYIQSSYEINSLEKQNNELDSLRLTKDFFKKIIIQNDIPESYSDESGILHCKLIDFLLNDYILF